MNTLSLRQKLIEIARQDVGQIEPSRNRGIFIKKYWPATEYADGYVDRAPYCAAAMCYWVQQWIAIPEVAKAIGKTPAQLEKWRCKSARAFDWQDWGEEKGLLVMSDSQGHTLHTGDIMVFDMSHIGLVVDDWNTHVRTIEANTGATGGRDGDGVFEKVRERSVARCFVRILP